VSAAGRDLPTAELLRRGVLGLVALGIVGTTVELLFLGHWGSPARTIVWPALAALAIGLFLLARRPSRTSIRAARAIAGSVAVVALVGVGFHVNENLAAGPLDRHFATTWDSLPAIRQWWLAVTGGVGPAPTLAPGVLLQLGLALLLATVRHPVLAAATAPAELATAPRAEGGTMSTGPTANGAT
jgi:hypothetical protein